MAENTHKTTIDVRANTDQAEQAIDKLQKKLQQTRELAKFTVGAKQGRGGGGGGGGGPGGGGGGGMSTEARIGELQRQKARVEDDPERRQEIDQQISQLRQKAARSTAQQSAKQEQQRAREVMRQRERVGQRLARGVGRTPQALQRGGGEMGVLDLAQTAALGGSSLMRAAGGASVLGPLALAGAPLALASGSVAQRYPYAKEATEFRTQAAFAQQLGVRGGRISPGMGAEAGVMPQQAAQQMRQFAAARGATQEAIGGRADEQDVFRLQRAGVGARTAGRFQSLAAPGGGGTNVDAEQMAGALGGLGLRGQNIERWLQAIAQNTNQMGVQQGIRTDTEAMANTVAQMQNTPGLRGAGQRIPAFLNNINRMRGSAFQQIAAPFQKMGQSALIAKAAQQGGPKEMMKFLQSTRSNPGEVMEAMTGMLGEDLGALAFQSRGLRAGEAEAAAGGLVGGTARGDLPQRMLAQVPEAKQAQARQAGERVGMMDQQTADELIKTFETFQTAVNKFTDAITDATF